MQKINFDKGFAVAILAIVVGAVIIAASIGVFVWFKFQPAPQLSGPPTPTPDPYAPSRIEDKSSPILSMMAQNNSGLKAEYRITAVGSPTGISSQTKIAINVTNPPANVSMPAHIHSGSCAKLGAVKYPLTNVVRGLSVTTLDVSVLQLIFGLPLAINIHKSVAELPVYVACADLNADGSLDTLYSSK